MFFVQKMYFFTQISERSTCTHLHHSNLDSGGQIYLKITKILSAYAKTTCWWNSSRLMLQSNSNNYLQKIAFFWGGGVVLFITFFIFYFIYLFIYLFLVVVLFYFVFGWLFFLGEGGCTVWMQNSCPIVQFNLPYAILSR